ncbi:MAG: hypothetical protein ABI885_27300 [Gammaproteobacteria bacterium]
MSSAIRRTATIKAKDAVECDAAASCERCGAASVRTPGYQRWLTANAPADSYVVRVAFHVRGAVGSEPALCLDCLRATITNALVKLGAHNIEPA